MKIHLIIGVLFLMIAIFLFMVVPQKYAFEFVLAHLLLVVAVLYNHYRFTRKSMNLHPLLSLDVVFLTGQTVIGFAIPLLLVLGLADVRDLRWRYPAEPFLLPAVSLNLVSIASFSVGFMLFNLRKLSRRFTNKLRQVVPTFRSPWFVLSTVIPGTILLLVFLAVEGQAYFTGKYVGTRELREQFAIMLWGAQVFLTVAASAVVLRSNSLVDYVVPINSVTLGVWGLLLLALAIHGDRGGVVQCGGPILFVVASRIPKRLGIPSIIAFLLLGLLFTSILRVARDKEERSMNSLIEAMFELDFSESLQDGAANLGGSGLITPVAIADTTQNDHTYGKHTLNAFLGIVPYSRRTLQSVGLLPEWQFPTTSNYFTYLINGPNATYGIGTNATAEFYLEFGLLGVVIGMFLVGAVAARIQRTADHNRPFDNYHVAHLYCVGLFAIMARYSPTDLIFRNVLYGIVVVYVASKICELLEGKRKRRAQPVPMLQAPPTANHPPSKT